MIIIPPFFSLISWSTQPQGLCSNETYRLLASPTLQLVYETGYQQGKIFFQNMEKFFVKPWKASYTNKTKLYLVDNMHTINQSSEVNKRFKNKWIVSLEFLVQMGDSKSGTQEVQGLVWDILSSQKARSTQRKMGSCQKGTRATLHWFPLPHLWI